MENLGLKQTHSIKKVNKLLSSSVEYTKKRLRTNMSISVKHER